MNELFEEVTVIIYRYHIGTEGIVGRIRHCEILTAEFHTFHNHIYFDIVANKSKCRTERGFHYMVDERSLRWK